MTSTPAMTIDVLLFASVREAAGVSRLALTVPPATTAGGALAALVACHPALAALAPTLRLAVNSEYADPGRPLAPGDELALIPPTCGG
jgi:molybdopterin converting factor subunit 1